MLLRGMKSPHSHPGWVQAPGAEDFTAAAPGMLQFGPALPSSWMGLCIKLRLPAGIAGLVKPPNSSPGGTSCEMLCKMQTTRMLQGHRNPPRSAPEGWILA